MTPSMVDLGWAMARIEETEVEGKGTLPMLTICWPASEEQPAGSVQLFDLSGLDNLALQLNRFLGEWTAQQEGIETT